MKKGNDAKAWRWLAIPLLLVIVAGCSGGSAAEPTLSSLGASVALTATAAKLEEEGENKLATAQAEATATSQAIQATRTARVAGQSEEQSAQATLAAPIVAELPQYGLDPAGGHVGWLHDPLTLEISGYQQMVYGNDHKEVTAADFALAADVTWDTQYGSSGCGFLFRSNGDQKKPDGYMILMSRFGNGHVIFTALAEGDIANVHDFYPKTEDTSFKWQNGTTNRLAIIARGNLIELYTNGVKIGEVDTTKPPQQISMPSKPLAPLDQSDTAAMNAYQAQLKEYEDILAQSQQMYQTALKNYSTREAVFTDGFLMMIAASESGRTSCKFEDAWLWLIDPSGE